MFPEKYNEREALRLMALGDEAAFRQIYDRYYARVFQAARYFLRSDDLAKDIVHEVFLTLLEKKDFTSVKQFEFYLHVIARNKSIDLLKKFKMEVKAGNAFALENGLVDISNERAEQLQQIEKMELLVEQAIEKLPPKRREIFLSRLLGLSYEAIGCYFNISEETVKTQLKRGRRDVASYLKHHFNAIVFLLCGIFME